MAQGYSGVPAGPLSAYLGVRGSNEEANMEKLGFLAKLQQMEQMRRENELFRRDQLAARVGGQKEAIAAREGIAAGQRESVAELARQRAADQQAAERRQAADREALARLTAQLRPAPPPNPVTPVRVIRGGKEVMIDARTGAVIGDAAPTGSQVTRQAADEKMRRELASITPMLEEISRDGGLLDQATGSGIGAGVDIAAGFVGYGTPGAIAIGKLKPMTDAVLKLVPRFEGPQSDKDLKTYQDAAGNLANPSTPNSVKKAAAKTILEIYKKRQGQFITKDYESTITTPSQGGEWKDL